MVNDDEDRFQTSDKKGKRRKAPRRRRRGSFGRRGRGRRKSRLLPRSRRRGSRRRPEAGAPTDAASAPGRLCRVHGDEKQSGSGEGGRGERRGLLHCSVVAVLFRCRDDGRLPASREAREGPGLHGSAQGDGARRGGHPGGGGGAERLHEKRKKKGARRRGKNGRGRRRHSSAKKKLSEKKRVVTSHS